MQCSTVIINCLVHKSAARHGSEFLLHVIKLSPSDDMLERNKDVVELHDIDAPSLKQLIDFAYTGECIITEENVQVGLLNYLSHQSRDNTICFQVLLPASSLLQIQSVREACCKFLLRQLHPSNVLGIRSFAGNGKIVLTIIQLAFSFLPNFPLIVFFNFHKFSSTESVSFRY